MTKIMSITKVMSVLTVTETAKLFGQQAMITQNY